LIWFSCKNCLLVAANEKRNSPRLDDDVYRIESIAKDGAYHQRLQEANIHTVQDFLKALNKDPDELYKVKKYALLLNLVLIFVAVCMIWMMLSWFLGLQILKMKRKGKSWSKMTGHARKRILEDRHELKAYQTDDGTMMLFFNCVHDLVGARFGSNYIACENFDIDHKVHTELSNNMY